MSSGVSKPEERRCNVNVANTATRQTVDLRHFLVFRVLIADEAWIRHEPNSVTLSAPGRVRSWNLPSSFWTRLTF